MFFVTMQITEKNLKYKCIMNAYKANTYLTTIQMEKKIIARTLLALSLPRGKHNFPTLLTGLVIFALLCFKVLPPSQYVV